MRTKLAQFKAQLRPYINHIRWQLREWKRIETWRLQRYAERMGFRKRKSWSIHWLDNLIERRARELYDELDRKDTMEKAFAGANQLFKDLSPTGEDFYPCVRKKEGCWNVHDV